MELVGLQSGFASGYPFGAVFTDRGAVIGGSARADQSGNINPANRVQSIGIVDDGLADGAGSGVETGYAYGPFYTNRLLYLDLQAELMVVQFRDALDREVRLQFPPELSLRAYRTSASAEREEPVVVVAGSGDADAAPPPPVLRQKAANDGLPEALKVDAPTLKSEPAELPPGVSPAIAVGSAPAPRTAVPLGQTVELRT
jgi:hypothetical protein